MGRARTLDVQHRTTNVIQYTSFNTRCSIHVIQYCHTVLSYSMPHIVLRAQHTPLPAISLPSLVFDVHPLDVVNTIHPKEDLLPGELFTEVADAVPASVTLR